MPAHRFANEELMLIRDTAVEAIASIAEREDAGAAPINDNTISNHEVESVNGGAPHPGAGGAFRCDEEEMVGPSPCRCAGPAHERAGCAEGELVAIRAAMFAGMYDGHPVEPRPARVRLLAPHYAGEDAVERRFALIELE
jgi:hypothetical protein